MADFNYKNFGKGETILDEGDEPEFAYILKSGTAKVYKKKTDGKDIFICDLKPGDIIGEMSLIDAAPRSATVIAQDDVTVILIDKANFDKLIENLDDFTSQLFKSLVRRLRIQNKQIAELSEPFDLLKAAEKGQVADKTVTPTKVVFTEDFREKQSFSAISTLLVSKNSDTRQSIKGGLHMQGFREIIDCSNAIDFRSICAINDYDLIYVDDSIGVNEASGIIDDIRHGRTQVCPFSVIFAAIEKPDPKTLEKFAEAGLDDILVKPVTIGNIVDRVEKRIKSRKPFVVTIDYIGPDRRTNQRPGKEEIPLVDVPNPVFYKANGQIDSLAYQRQVAHSIEWIEKLKIERHAVQIDWLRGRIKMAIDEDQNPDFFIRRTNEVTEKLVEKLRKVNDDANIDLCSEIVKMISDFQAGMAEMKGPDWENYSSMTRNLKKRLGPKEAQSPE